MVRTLPELIRALELNGDSCSGEAADILREWSDAIFQLSMALGNPAVRADQGQTIEGSTVRFATQWIKERR